MMNLTKRIRCSAALCMVAAFVVSSCSQKENENEVKNEIQSANDVVVIGNANILTMNPGQPNATAMATKGDKILAVGDLDEVKKAVGKDFEYVDLKGATVTPGFIETHEHLVNLGGTLVFPDITATTTPTIKAALEKLKKEGTPDKNGWINGWAIDENLYEDKRGPTLQELDALFPDVPVFIWHMSGHAGYTNSKGYQRKGLTKDTPNPKGGAFSKDENGELNGHLSGAPAAMMVGAYPEISLETTINAAKVHASLGFTTSSEDGITGPLALKLLKEATQSPDFPVRVIGGLYYTFPGLYETAAHISNYENDLFEVLQIKWAADGSTQGGTSFYSEPFYKLDSDTRKGAHVTQEEMNENVLKALQAGFGSSIHANGDGAMDLALNGIEYARKKSGNSDLRMVLIHCQYVRQDQFDRIAEMGNIGMSFFPAHVYYWGDLHRDLYIGPERVAHINSIQSAIKRGIPYGIHNDAPVTHPNALHSMWVAVNRLTKSGKVLGPEERITPEQALVGYTRSAAYVLSMEDQVGTLEVGKMADYVVLEESPLDVDPMKIKDIKIRQTVMGGMTTYMAE